MNYPYPNFQNCFYSLQNLGFVARLQFFPIRNAAVPPITLPITVNGSGTAVATVELPEITKLSTYRSGVPPPVPNGRVIWMPSVTIIYHNYSIDTYRIEVYREHSKCKKYSYKYGNLSLEVS
jgi:hypothetical protein